MKVGDKVKIETPWGAKDKEFPNVTGIITGFRHGGNVAIVETTEGRTPRNLHVGYLSNDRT
jgi:hypothetical protein